MKTIRSIIILLLTAPFFFTASGWVIPGQSEAAFTQYVNAELSPKRIPAAVTDLSEEQLREKGYVKIGKVEVTHWVDYCEGSNCQPDPPENSTTHALKEAALNGGDLVILWSDNVRTDLIEGASKEICLDTKKVAVPMVVPGTSQPSGRMAIGKECVRSKIVLVRYREESSRGSVWRLDPGLLSSPDVSDFPGAGYALVQEPDSYVWIFIDASGQQALPGKYAKAMNFSEGLAAVMPMSMEPPLRWGFIDRNGRMAIPPVYTEVQSFSGGLAAVTRGEGLDRKWGFINRSGRLGVAPWYDSVGPFSEGLAAATRNDDAGYIDRTGLFVFKVPLVKASYLKQPVSKNVQKYCWPFKEGYALIRHYGKADTWTLVDHQGKPLVEPGLYPYINEFFNGRARVTYEIIQKGKKFIYKIGYLDREGNLHREDMTEPVADDMGFRKISKKKKVKVKGEKFKVTLYGYENARGNTVIKPKYLWLGPFSGGLAGAKPVCDHYSKYESLMRKNPCPNGYINREGEMVITPRFKNVKSFAQAADLDIPD